MLKVIFLLKQARDKHRESSTRKRVAFIYRIRRWRITRGCCRMWICTRLLRCLCFALPFIALRCAVLRCAGSATLTLALCCAMWCCAVLCCVVCGSLSIRYILKCISQYGDNQFYGKFKQLYPDTVTNTTQHNTTRHDTTHHKTRQDKTRQENTPHHKPIAEFAKAGSGLREENETSI